MIRVREHKSDRFNKARLQLEVRRGMNPLLVYLAGLAVAAACVVFIAGNLPNDGGLSRTRTAVFAVRDATGVVPQRAEVRVKGIPAGTVSDVKLIGGHAIITARIDARWGTVYRDAEAVLRPNTPLQDVYLDILRRGTPAAGRATAGSPVPESRTEGSVNISDVLQTFTANARSHLRGLLSQFGAGVDGRGDDLRRAFVRVAPFVQTAQRLANQLQIREHRTRRLVHNATLLTQELGRRDTDVRRLVNDGASIAQTTAGRAPALDAALLELPKALAVMDSSFTSLRGVLPDVDAAVRSLRPVADRLTAGLNELRRLSSAGTPAVTALQPAVRGLVPLTHQLRPLSTGLDHALTRLQPQIPAIDHITRSLAACGHTIQRFFGWTQSVFSMGDAHGEAPRGDASIGIDTPGIVNDPNVTAAPTCSNAPQTNGIQPLIRP